MPEDARINAQLTEFIQGYLSFRAAYSGQNSLPPGCQIRQTTSITAYMGVRMLWAGAEFYFNPEYFQGFGVAETLGIAGFANGDAQKAGNRVGVLSVARLFLFQSTNIQTGAAWTATARRWTFWPSAAQAHANDSEQYA